MGFRAFVLLLAKVIVTVLIEKYDDI